MDERIIKFRVGVMVVSTIFIGGLLVLLFGDTGSIVRGHYTIHIHFSDAPGVTEGTPVRKSGILIGRVTKVAFADQGGVNVTAEIRSDVKLYRSEVPQVTGSLLGGDVVIQFVRRTRPSTSEPPPGAVPETQTADPPADKSGAAPKAPAGQGEVLIGEGDYLEGVVSPSPVQVITNLEGNLATAVDSLSNAGDEVAKVATSINRLLAGNEEKIDHIIDGMEATLGSFQKTLDNIDDVIGKPEVRENLRQAIAEMPQLLSDTRSTMNTMKTTVESVDRNLRNLEGFTGPLGDRGEQIVSRADQAIKRLDTMLLEFSDFGRKLNSGEGSLGKIMRDPALYQNLDKATRNIAQLTCELRPIVADARVFADKIARHPELLGVRGAIQKSPGTK
jgi:phospholipid/cholesterol/gamma-HCH transport system substrate-binding protein